MSSFAGFGASNGGAVARGPTAAGAAAVGITKRPRLTSTARARAESAASDGASAELKGEKRRLVAMSSLARANQHSPRDTPPQQRSRQLGAMVLLSAGRCRGMHELGSEFDALVAAYRLQLVARNENPAAAPSGAASSSATSVPSLGVPEEVASTCRGLRGRPTASEMPWAQSLPFAQHLAPSMCLPHGFERGAGFALLGAYTRPTAPSTKRALKFMPNKSGQQRCNTAGADSEVDGDAGAAADALLDELLGPEDAEALRAMERLPVSVTGGANAGRSKSSGAPHRSAYPSSTGERARRGPSKKQPAELQIWRGSASVPSQNDSIRFVAGGGGSRASSLVAGGAAGGGAHTLPASWGACHTAAHASNGYARQLPAERVREALRLHDTVHDYGAGGLHYPSSGPRCRSLSSSAAHGLDERPNDRLLQQIMQSAGDSSAAPGPVSGGGGTPAAPLRRKVGRPRKIVPQPSSVAATALATGASVARGQHPTFLDGSTSQPSVADLSDGCSLVDLLSRDDWSPQTAAVPPKRTGVQGKGRGRGRGLGRGDGRVSSHTIDELRADLGAVERCVGGSSDVRPTTDAELPELPAAHTAHDVRGRDDCVPAHELAVTWTPCAPPMLLPACTWTERTSISTTTAAGHSAAVDSPAASSAHPPCLLRAPDLPGAELVPVGADVALSEAGVARLVQSLRRLLLRGGGDALASDAGRGPHEVAPAVSLELGHAQAQSAPRRREAIEHNTCLCWCEAPEVVSVGRLPAPACLGASQRVKDLILGPDASALHLHSGGTSSM